MRGIGPFIVAAWGGFLAVMFIMLFTGTALTEWSWCIAGEDHCVREWVAALSGWAAAVAAGVTVYGLYEQIREQRKQTEFVVGDAAPTADLLSDQDDNQAIHLRIVNWNRRSILIEGFYCTDNPYHPVAMKVKVDGEKLDHQKWATDAGFDIAKPIIVDGWEDRNKAPHFAKIEVWGIDEAGELVRFDAFRGSFEVKIVIIGDRHVKQTLKVHAGIGVGENT